MAAALALGSRSIAATAMLLLTSFHLVQVQGRTATFRRHLMQAATNSSSDSNTLSGQLLAAQTAGELSLQDLCILQSLGTQNASFPSTNATGGPAPAPSAPLNCSGVLAAAPTVVFSPITAAPSMAPASAPMAMGSMTLPVEAAPAANLTGGQSVYLINPPVTVIGAAATPTMAATAPQLATTEQPATATPAAAPQIPAPVPPSPAAATQAQQQATASPESSSSGTDNKSGGFIAGVAIAAVVGAALISAAMALIVMRSSKKA